MKDSAPVPSLLYAGNSEFIEALYEAYLQDPASVTPEWRDYFASVRGTDLARGPVSTRQQIARFYRQRAQTCAASGQNLNGEMCRAIGRKQTAVYRLINAYRLLGHHRALVDPIKLRGMPLIPDLDPSFYGLSDADLDSVFNTGTLIGHIPAEMPLGAILKMLRETYTQSIGAEFMHISDVEEKRWLMARLEGQRSRMEFPREDRLRMLDRLTAAEGLETYLHTKYTGQKRFSLEGGDVLIPALDVLIQRAGGQQVEEIVIGMAHRGRLNVLVNIMGRSPAELFSEFEGRHNWKQEMMGDVKYHQGYSSDIQTPGGVMHLALGFNPSHLEIIDPVTEGSVRSRQDRRGDHAHKKVMALLIHGDAAFAGQGVVYETFNLSQTRGYTTGGTIHVVVNNRIGFTTSHPLDVRSTLYCTDVGKVVQAPIFHVNGDDPEAVAYVVRLAVDFRMRFKRDVIIDLVCYRRHGHNEADEPAVTQPMMYRKIRAHPTPRQVYVERVVGAGLLTTGEADGLLNTYREALVAGRQVALDVVTGQKNPYRVEWEKYRKARWTDAVETALPTADFRRLGATLNNLPEDFELHPRVAKIVDDRAKMSVGALPGDWGFAEIMAYASLLEAGFHIRLSGQDSGRGTFFHRHAVLHNQRTGDDYVPLRHLAPEQPDFTVIDSILSEEAVLGFEYGYSAADPDTLVIWEAQFGDFANGAQVVIDQFLVAGEQKWRLLTGLVLMLPHGWEGQGAEHTSARLERFMQLCAQDNIQVCYPSTPAQMFHLLRRQMLRRYRKPLVIMTPKSMLRLKTSFSVLEDFTGGSFRTMIGETEALKPVDVQRVVLCSGKVYYDLLEARREKDLQDTALLRLEQLYPFPAEALTRELKRYSQSLDIVWAQEEPLNQGAWFSIRDALRDCLQPGQSLTVTARLPSASPAGGDYHRHLERRQQLIEDALALQRRPATLAQGVKVK